MARNIPKFQYFKITSEDDSDIPNSFNTTSTPELNDNELFNGSGNNERVGFFGTTYHGRLPHVIDMSSTSSNSGGKADFTIRKVGVFDMRGKIEKSVKCKDVFIEAPYGVLEQRLASMQGVLQNQLLFFTVPEYTIRTITYAAILDFSYIHNLTVFLKLDPENPCNYRCINLPKDSGVRFLLDKLNLSPPSWPFWKGQRMQDTSSLFDQGVITGDNINMYKIRTETVKCLYRTAPKYEQLFSVECLTIDSILELKQKIRDTIRSLNRIHNPISESVLNSHIWLTSGKRIYRDEEYICLLESDLDSSSDSSDSLSITYYDYVLHFQPPDCIPIRVTYRVGDTRNSSVETVIVPKQSSTTHLCEHISKLLHCLPCAVKLNIQGKKLPMSDDLSTFSEFKPGCMVYASVKRAITVIVSLGDALLKFPIMKMDKVQSLKCKIADEIKTPPSILKLKFNGKELVDFHRIEQEDIKDNSTVDAEIVEDRIQISIRKRTHPIKHFIVENLEETKIRDLKNYYRHVVGLSAKLDIDLYTKNTCSQLDDFATLKFTGTKDKDIFFAIEKISAEGKYMKIYEAHHNGYATIKLGMIQNGMIFYCALDPGTVTENNQEDHVYTLPSACCNIRLAQSFEIEPFEFSSTPEPLLHVQSLLSIKPNLSVLPKQPSFLRQFSNMSLSSSSTITVMNRTVDGSPSVYIPIRDPPDVVSDIELQKLANELPGHNWQRFIRDLGVVNGVIMRHSEAYPKNITEAIYQCLNDWKQSNGKDAKKSIIQKKLYDNELRALSESIFEYATV
ncbi:hypothetical protein LOTGIDRAFT_154877 [Lottia gigantea]|uniref:Death domain-containing protein n=1 Tax=Lottia gigantea TaxID=225164 RepID=V3ZM66_LOTGI|nr:hypothetical protein LOTGIDRAFT_154877 [Lottia gigantea]ESO85382.1 hypothetical protein LOTGIDRAFT_154877 [Lottia gigantea]